MADKLSFKNEDTVKLGNVDGDVEIRNCRSLEAEEGGQITISGTLYIVDELEINSSLQCGRLESKSRDQITVHGNLTVEKSATIPRGSLVVYGDAKARDFEVGASFKVDGNLECVSAKAGASIKVTGDAKAQRLTGGASVKIEGNVDVETPKPKKVSRNTLQRAPAPSPAEADLSASNSIDPAPSASSRKPITAASVPASPIASRR